MTEENEQLIVDLSDTCIDSDLKNNNYNNMEALHNFDYNDKCTCTENVEFYHAK